MRLSSDPASPFYKGDDAFFCVLLDGAEQTLTAEADDEEGWVIRAVIDTEGNVAIEGEAGDERIKLETVFGAVQLVRI